MTQHWRDHARCKGMDTELFFPVTEDSDAEPVRRAKSVCAACAVRDTCLAEALAAHDVHGIRGGLAGSERVHLLRRRVAA